MVELAIVDVEDVAVVPELALPEQGLEDDRFIFPASLLFPPDIPAVRDMSLAVPSVNGNFPPRGDLRL